MGDIGRRQARFEVLPLAGGAGWGDRDVEDDAARAADSGWADRGTELVDADTEPARSAAARTEPARS